MMKEAFICVSLQIPASSRVHPHLLVFTNIALGSPRMKIWMNSFSKKVVSIVGPTSRMVPASRRTDPWPPEPVGTRRTSKDPKTAVLKLSDVV